MCFLIVFFSGFSVFFPGNWSVASFLSNYVRLVFLFERQVVVK